MARRIEVEIVGDSRQLERAFARSEKSAQKFNREMGRQGRVAQAQFSSVAVGWQTALAGGALLLGRKFVKEARDAEVILGQTQVALSDAGLSWQRYGKTIEDASTRISNSSALDDEQVLQSFQVFVRGQKNVEKSLELTQLAADVARGRYIDLEQATQLVNKAAMGQVGALRRAGIQIDKNATSAEALDALYKAYTGSAKTYADSATGSSEKLQVAWDNLAQTAGGPLSLALANVADQLTIVVGLMQKAKDIDIPDGGFLGKVLKGAATGIFPGFAIPGLLGGAGGGRTAGPPVPATMPRAPTSRFFWGAKPEMSAGSFFDSIDNIVKFTTKWVDAGARFGAAQKRFIDNQKKLAAERDRMQLKRQRVLAGRENQLGWLDFGLERAETTKGKADNLRVLQKREQLIKSWIQKEGRTLKLVQELWRTRQQIRDLNRKKAKEAKELEPSGFRHVSAGRLAGMLGLAGNRRAEALLAQVGRGGAVPTGTGQYGGVVITGPVNVHGVQDVAGFTNQMRKQARGAPHVRRGAR